MENTPTTSDAREAIAAGAEFDPGEPLMRLRPDEFVTVSRIIRIAYVEGRLDLAEGVAGVGALPEYPDECQVATDVELAAYLVLTVGLTEAARREVA